MIVEILSCVICFICLVFDHYFKLNGQVGLSLFFKMAASACFIILAISSVIKCKEKSDDFKKTRKFILIGLILGFCADLFLELNFYVGFVIFVAGHICYYFAFSVYSKMSAKKWIGAFVFIFAFIGIDLICPWFDFKGLFGFVIFYGAVWAFVMVKSVESFKWKSVQAKTMPLGIILFGISDILLQFPIFPVADFSKTAESILFFISNFFYYSAQLLIAYSISKDYLEVSKN